MYAYDDNNLKTQARAIYYETHLTCTAVCQLRLRIYGCGDKKQLLCIFSIVVMHKSYEICALTAGQ